MSATQLDPIQLATLLSHTIPAHEPVLVVGQPGVGKSAVIEQAARAAGADFMLCHPVVDDPTDYKGLPMAAPGDDAARFLPFGNLARMLSAERLLVVVLDDIGQAPPAVQAALMQLTLARQVNGKKLPDCVVFIAATNRREDRAGVSGILEPVKSRFATIVELVPSLDASCAYALENGWPIEIPSYWRFRPEILCSFEPSADMTNSPIPRTWDAAGRILGLHLPADIEHAAIAGAIGEGAAAEFVGFLKLCRELPNLDGVLIDPMSEPIPDRPAALYATVTGLGSRASESNFGSIAQYAQRLLDDSKGEFAVLLIRDSIRRAPAVKDTGAFVSLASGDLGQLLS